MRALAFLLGVVALACGARTRLEVPNAPLDGSAGARDAGPDDAGTRPDVFRPPDAGPPDAGPPDAFRPDAGPLIECEREADCEGAFVCGSDARISPRDLAPLALACSPPWGPRIHGEACTEASQCETGICLVSGTCATPCRDNSDCEDTCAAVHARSAARALQPLRACVRRITCPGEIRVTESEARTMLGGPGSRDEVALPRIAGAGATSRPVQVIVAEPPGDGAIFWRLSTAGATRTNLFDLESLAPGSPHPINPVNFLAAPLTVQFPSGTRRVAAPTGLVASIESTVRNTAHVVTLLRSGMGSRLLDLDIWYVGAPGLRPAGDRGPREVAAALAEVERNYAGAGIRIGEVRQHEVVGALLDRYSVIEAGPEGGEHPDLLPLMRLSAGANRPSINVYLVRSIDDALGISGGIPGPLCFHGTGSSGVAIAVELLPMTDLSLGQVLSHELGHHLGLFHTTEVDGTQVEALDGTAECPVSRDTDGDGFLLDFECRGFGADNLMFWSASDANLVAEQNEVIGAAVVLR